MWRELATYIKSTCPTQTCSVKMGKDLKKLRRQRQQIGGVPTKKSKLNTSDECVISISESSIDAALDKFFKDVGGGTSRRSISSTPYTLINEHRYHIPSTSVIVKIGLDPTSNFDPVIILENTLDIIVANDDGRFISFELFDWWQIVRCLERGKVEYLEPSWSVEEEERPFSASYRNYKVYGKTDCSSSSNNRSLVVSQDDGVKEVILDEEAIIQLSGAFATIIEQHLNNLLNHRFHDFYNEILVVIQNTLMITLQPPRVVKIEHVLELIKKLCSISNTVNCLCMLECLVYLKEKLNNDIVLKYTEISIIH